MEVLIDVVNRAVDPLQDEILRIFAILDAEGQTEVLACAYREALRMKGIIQEKRDEDEEKER